MEKLKSAKMWFAILVLVAASVFLLLGKLNGTEWVSVVSFVGTGFFAARVVSKNISVKNGFGRKKK